MVKDCFCECKLWRSKHVTPVSLSLLIQITKYVSNRKESPIRSKSKHMETTRQLWKRLGRIHIVNSKRCNHSCIILVKEVTTSCAGSCLLAPAERKHSLILRLFWEIFPMFAFISCTEIFHVIKQILTPNKDNLSACKTFPNIVFVAYVIKAV